MKNIEIDEELYQYIAANTQFIGESASAILRRLLAFSPSQKTDAALKADIQAVSTVSESTVASLKMDTSLESKVKVNNLDAKSVAKNAFEDNVSEDKKVLADDNNHTVFNYINKEELAMQRGAVGRFLLILAALYRAHNKSFNVVTDICGRDRLYFAHTEEELAASGSSTKPRQIPDSPYWVITNSNTTRKKMMLTKASTSLGYNAADVEKIRELL